MLGDRALTRLRQVAALPDLGGGRYTLMRELGRGGMGVVYLAEDRDLGRTVALKVFHLDDVDAALRERLRQEARTLARLEHPNIVPVYDLGTAADGRLFYTMKFVEGQRLDHWATGPHTLQERLRIFERLCEAIAYVHACGLTHRDLKPANIMVGSFGECFVMDWGLAKPAGETEPHIVGTPAYRAPEQAVAGAAADPRADVFSLGRILDGLAGDAAPKPLSAIVTKAVSPSPADRYPCAKELAADVLNYLDGLAVSAHRETWLELLGRQMQRHQIVLLLIVTYVVVRTVIFLATRLH
ncbi:MAG: serine/threonine protein kinase [Bryobacterales bacterium]|nr:serine/threonine protein kinase [Bryobacterales bacterium]